MISMQEHCEPMLWIGNRDGGLPAADLIAEVVPAMDEPVSMNLLGLVELILKRPERFEKLIRQPDRQAVLLPRFLAIALVGFVFFGVALSLVFTAAGQWPRLTPIRDVVAGESTTVVVFETLTAGQSPLTLWIDGSALKMVFAYALGLVAATGICLPSLYFYSLLPAVRMTMLDVVIQALKSKATTAVALVGILPIYAALGLGIVIFEAPQPIREAAFWLGLALPFLAGLFGTYSLYRSLGELADTLPPERRCGREWFLQRLVLSWAACYTVVTPVMIHALWALLTNV